ncbi:SLOG family protein [Streptomyces sp. NPDC047821]|uniref:SLOG family protein n=1 Tax=Streptomyces sp. NPDC047821 TaxID=3365488 RepID=UPI0037139E86
MRVIVTGSRRWSDKAAVWDALNAVYQEHGPFLLVHGDCSTGADAMAREWVEAASRLVQVQEQRFPAAWDYWAARGNAKRAGPERNRRMVEAGADLVLAFPLPEGSGTQHTIKLAREAGIEVRVIKHE